MVPNLSIVEENKYVQAAPVILRIETMQIVNREEKERKKGRDKKKKNTRRKVSRDE
jgi:hypothetical protein